MIDVVVPQTIVTETQPYPEVSPNYSDEELATRSHQLAKDGKFEEAIAIISVLSESYPQNQQLKILKSKLFLDLKQYQSAIDHIVPVNDEFVKYQVLVVAHLNLENYSSAILFYMKWKELNRKKISSTPQEPILCPSTMAKLVAIMLSSGDKDGADREFTEWAKDLCKGKDYNLKTVMTCAPLILKSGSAHSKEDYVMVTKMTLAVLGNWCELALKWDLNRCDLFKFVHCLHVLSPGYWFYAIFGALCACRLGEYERAIEYIKTYSDSHHFEKLPHLCITALMCKVDGLIEKSAGYYFDHLLGGFPVDFHNRDSLTQTYFEKLVQFLKEKLNVKYFQQ